MQCPTCGTVLPEGTAVCPTCGEALAQPTATPTAPSPEDPSRGQTALLVGLSAVALVLLGVVVAGVVLLVVPAYRTRTPVGRAESTPASVEPTATTSEREQSAAEALVTGFYGAVNSKDFGALTSMVTSDTTPAVAPSAFRDWKPTTFGVARSVIGSDSASVYGRESVRALGGKDKGVKFTLARVGGAWLIKKWQAVDEGTVTGAMPAGGQAGGVLALTDATARDVVSTLLQARQQGDPSVIRLLTTVKFQEANAETWLDGVDNAESFTGFTIANVKKQGSRLKVTVKETWTSKVRVSTYTVVMNKQTILVDGWSVR